MKADESRRRHFVSTAPNLAREETPLVYSMGTYELETKAQMRQERKKDLEDFVHEQVLVLQEEIENYIYVLLPVPGTLTLCCNIHISVGELKFVFTNEIVKIS